MFNTLNLTQALANLFSAKLRSLLAVLGILVGTASVVAMVSSGEMASEKALAQFKMLGTDLLAINLYDEKSSPTQTAVAFSLKDALLLPEIVHEIKKAAPYTTLYAPISFEGNPVNGASIGVTNQLQAILKIELASGRFISFLDQQVYYCVIGAKIFEQLQKFGVHNPLGKQIYLDKTIFTIIGVAKPWLENNFFNEDINNSVLIPIRSTNILSRYANINNIIMNVQESADIDALQQKITTYIKQIAPPMKLFFRSAKQLIQKMEEQSRTLTLLLGLIGSISLIVGGIGVMNIMLVSVIERRKEIGIRLAIGARRKDIQHLFLLEAFLLAIFGGSLGVIIGILTSVVIAYFADWTFELFLLPVMVGFLVSVATGIFFGYYPAYKAAQLDPIEALHTD